MHTLGSIPAVWALSGAAVYEGQRLMSALWRGAEIDARGRKFAIGQCAIGLLFAPVAAQALTPMVLRLSGLGDDALGGVALVIGLFVNAVWPVMTERGFIRRVVGSWLYGLGVRLIEGKRP